LNLSQQAEAASKKMSGKSPTAKGPEDLLRAAGALKTIKRKGWTKAGITDQESVADHSFRMAVLGAYLSEEMKLDREKIILMCLIHDLAESKIGDLTPEEKISEKVHRSNEDRVMRQLLATLPNRERKTFLADWSELVEAKTKEARLVWQIDKLEMGLTMKDYFRAGRDRQKLAEFNPASHLSRELKAILEEY
jgi:putative hydrolases of HD superfamily